MAARNRARTQIETVLMGKLGSRLNRSNRFAYLSYFPDSIRQYKALPGFRAALLDWCTGNARNNAGDVPRLVFLLQNARQVMAENVAGHFAELGVHKGHSAKLLAEVLAQHGAERHIYLFDTFEGFDVRDLRGVDATVPRLFGDTSLETVREMVGHPELCKFYPGYFPKSAESIPTQAAFAFVHLDCDLYQPMAAALAFFYPRLSKGAVLMIHDYSSGHWPGVADAVSEFLEDKPERVVLMPDKSGTAVLRKH